MRILRFWIALVVTMLLVPNSTAQTTKPKADMSKAIERYQNAILDAERTLRSNLEKASAKSKDKASSAKIAYESDRFEKCREVPNCIQTKEYSRARNAAIAALAAQFEPVIQAQRTAKNPDDADELEKEYAKLVKQGRGFGLAIPDPATSPLVVIRSRQGDLVLEPVDPTKFGSKVTLSKYVRGRPSQVWRVERGEDGFAFRNSVEGLYLHIPASSGAEGEKMVLWRPEGQPNIHFSWKADERLSEVVLVSSLNDLLLTSKEINEKGVINTFLTQEKKLKQIPAAQVWKLEVQK